MRIEVSCVLPTHPWILVKIHCNPKTGRLKLIFSALNLACYTLQRFGYKERTEVPQPYPAYPTERRNCTQSGQLWQ